MKNPLELIMLSAIISIPFAVIEVLIDKWLVLHGYKRANDKIWSVYLGIYLVVIAKQIFFQDMSWWIAGFFILLGSIFSSNRYELNQSFRKGRWWWKSTEKKTKSTRSKIKNRK